MTLEALSMGLCIYVTINFSVLIPSLRNGQILNVLETSHHHAHIMLLQQPGIKSSYLEAMVFLATALVTFMN